MATRYPREQLHRIKYTKLTPEQILSRLTAAADGPKSATSLSEVMASKSVRIVLDGGPALSYRFSDGKRLSLPEGDAAAVQAGYGALTLDRIVLFSHMVPRTQRGYTVAIDQETNLATVLEARVAEARRKARFSTAPNGAPVERTAAAVRPPARLCRPERGSLRRSLARPV